MNKSQKTEDRERITENRRRKTKDARRSPVIGHRSSLIGYCYSLFAICYLLLSTACLYAAPHHTISVDGDLSDWLSDEKRISDESDSNWNPGTDRNEIKNLYVTWDESNLYIGIEGKVENNGLLLFLDSEPDKGYTDLTQINTWNRKVRFENFKPDYFYGAWDGSDGNFYRLKSSMTVEDISGRCVLKNSKTSRRFGWELKIPFDILYSRGNNVPPGTKISLCASLATGDVGRDSYGAFGYLGGDTAPNNNFVTGFSTATLKTFESVTIDENSDGLPDNAYGTSSLQISQINILPVKFAPAIHNNSTISFQVNKPATSEVTIFNLDGDLIKRLSEGQSSREFFKTFTWDGKDSGGNKVKSGVYIINIKVDSSSESRRLNKAVVVVR